MSYAPAPRLQFIDLPIQPHRAFAQVTIPLLGRINVGEMDGLWPRRGSVRVHGSNR